MYDHLICGRQKRRQLPDACMTPETRQAESKLLCICMSLLTACPVPGGVLLRQLVNSDVHWLNSLNVALLA
jgi:hypothetical protein